MLTKKALKENINQLREETAEEFGKVYKVLFSPTMCKDVCLGQWLSDLNQEVGKLTRRVRELEQRRTARR